MDRLAADFGSAMVGHAPPGTTWSKPVFDACSPIGLPGPGWYAVGHVSQEGPDREFQFHLAIDAAHSKVVASTSGDQRSMHDTCTLSFGQMVDHADAPSDVTVHEACVDKMEHSSVADVVAKITPPQIVLIAK